MTLRARIRILVLGLVLGFASTATAALVGYASARADSGSDAPIVIPASFAPAAPSTGLSDPTADPLGAIDDFEAARRHGWPVVVIGTAIMLALALRSIGKRWPGVGWIAWLNAGKRAFAIAGVITVGSAVFDVLVLGGTPYAAGWAGVMALLALLGAEAKR
jgi:hypothetical protein